MKDKTVYQTIIRPVVMQGLEVWTLSKSDENSSEMWERKILRRIFGPVTETRCVCVCVRVWRICTSPELMNLHREPYIMSEIKKGRLRWLGHVERVSEESNVNKVFKNSTEGRRSIGKPKRRWLDVENHLKKMGVGGFRKTAKDTDA